MIIFRHLLAAAFVLGTLCLLPGTARAAQSYDSCVGFIDSLPATISTPGTWCLRKDLATSMTSGHAIGITTNNVTIDCNDFKIGGLAAGNTSTAVGISASKRQNVTVRHCNVRGFFIGINLAGTGGAGHLVEDNRLDNSLSFGIFVYGENNRVQRNRVYDTGGRPGSNYSYGIQAAADVIDNTVAGVFATGTNTTPAGIHATGSGSEVRGNQVRGLAAAGSGYATGIFASGSGITVADNRVSAATLTVGQGILGFGANTFCTGNTVGNFATAYSGCERNLDNLSLP